MQLIQRRSQVCPSTSPSPSRRLRELLHSVTLQREIKKCENRTVQRVGVSPSNDDFYVAPNKQFQLVSRKLPSVSGYFAMKHSRLAGQWCKENSPGSFISSKRRKPALFTRQMFSAQDTEGSERAEGWTRSSQAKRCHHSHAAGDRLRTGAGS